MEIEEDQNTKMGIRKLEKHVAEDVKNLSQAESEYWNLVLKEALELIDE